MKKLIWVLGALVLAGVLMCGVASADSNGTDGSIAWSLSDEGVLTISGLGEMNDYGSTNVNGIPTTTAPWGASATSVIIVDGVTSIGKNAFSGCVSLSGITIPYTVNSIGDNAFFRCSALANVQLPGNTISIGNYCFCGCSSLTYISIPDKVVTLGNYAFYNCDHLISIEIPSSVRNIGAAAFLGCNCLNNVTIPDGITDIGSGTFGSCISLTDISMPNGLISIGEGAFRQCNSLSNIVIPDGVTTIGEAAFELCYNLTSITLPDSISSIGDYAFIDSSLLSEVFYKGTQESWNSISIGNDNENLTGATIRFNYGAPVIVDSGTCGAEGDNLTWMLDDAGTLTISGTGDMSNYSQNPISSTISTAPWGSGVISLIICDGVTSIGNYAFYYCRSLTSITIADSVTSIGNYAFTVCGGLTNVIIPNGVTSIGSHAFSDCAGLMSITIPDSVISIGGCAFLRCNKLSEIHIDSIESWLTIEYVIQYGDYSSHPNYPSSGCRLFIGETELTSIAIPDSVTSISPCALNNCIGLTSIIIPDSVTSIGGAAFYNCSGLTSISIPDSVTSIGYNAFSGCSSLKEIHIDSIESWLTIDYGEYGRRPNESSSGCRLFIGETELTSITIPESVTSIGSSAFYGCSGLTSVTIPGNVTSIGSSAFYGCSGLTSVTIRDGVTSIGEYAFVACSGLTSITIPDSVTSIGNYAFSGCGNIREIHINSIESWLTIQYGYDDRSRPNYTSSGCRLFVGETELTSVTIPDGMTRIGNSTFYNCIGITSVSIPDSVTTIGSYAFYNCSSLTSVTYGALVIEVEGGLNAIGLCGTSIVWTVNGNGLLSISGRGSINNYRYEPEDQYSDAYCSAPWFSYRSRINRLVIGEGITSIGSNDFALLTNIHSVTLPSTLQSIETGAFRDCAGFSGITIPDGVTSIGSVAFDNCINLSEITFCGEAPDIASSAFASVVANVNYISYSSWDGKIQNYGGTLTWVIVNSICGTDSSWILDNASVLRLRGSGTVTESTWSQYANGITTLVIAFDVGGIDSGILSTLPHLQTIIFEGAIPENIATNAFAGISATAYYPHGVSSWTTEQQQGYGGTLNWQPYCTHAGALINEFEAVHYDETPPADCTTDGSVEHWDCSLCGYSFADENLTQLLSNEDLIIAAPGHSLILIEGFAATCTDSGLSDEIFCEVCGETLQTQEEIPALGHTDSVTIEALDPTCMTEGHTEQHVCEVCGEILAVSETIPATGHTYGQPAIAWSEDGTTCTFTFVCEHEDDTQVLEITAEATVQEAPGCETMGTTLYTATAELNEQTYSDTTTRVDIAATGHTPVDDPAVAPTDRETGLTAGSHCEACGTVLVAQETIPALWSYTEDGLTATAYNGTETALTIPAGVTTLSNTLFKNNTTITSVVIPDSVTTIGTQTFFGASALTDVWLPDTLDGIGTQTFYNMTAVLHASMDSQTARALSLRNKSFTDGEWTLRYRVTSLTSTPSAVYLVAWNGDAENLVLPAAFGGAPLTQILAGAFDGQTQLLTVTIPDSVTTIATGAFINCNEDLIIRSSCSAYARTWASDNGIAWEHDHHTPTVVAAVAATCTETGLTEGSICSECGAVITAQEVIPALGHEWSEVEYIWAEDNTTVTATRTCAHDPEHIETETVGVTAEITKPAGCTEAGETTYTSAAFENEAFTVQTKTLADVKAVGHAWGDPTYTWAEDNSTVTATQICGNDAEHVETETVSVTAEVTTQPTCLIMGETTYTSLAFGNVAFTVQTKTLTNVDALGHAWGEPTYTWAEDNNTVAATRVCGNDAEHVETETVSVTRVVTTSPSQTAEGTFKYVSSAFENEAFGIQEKDGGTIPALSAMTAPTFPANLTTIEDEAFENTPFQSIIIPDSVTTIGNRAFANCRNLIYMRVPAGVTVPADAFAGCPNVIIEYADD